MSIDRALLDIVCCPVTRSPLQLLPERKLHRLNELIRRGKITNRDDAVLDAPLEEALMTRDEKLAYPVRDGIPVLLEEEGIALAQLDQPDAA
jgi:uncharacterized protein YbaR (Trm112 family)